MLKDFTKMDIQVKKRTLKEFYNTVKEVESQLPSNLNRETKKHIYNDIHTMRVGDTRVYYGVTLTYKNK